MKGSGQRRQLVVLDRPRLPRPDLCRRREQLEVIAREARAKGKERAAHYAHLVVHGVLHLQGYDHATGRQARRMERREARIVTALGYPDPYGGRPT